jgi:hypothetical protein
VRQGLRARPDRRLARRRDLGDGAEGAVNIIGRSAIEASDDPEATREAMLNAVREQIDPYIAAGNAVIDDIIDPRETRRRSSRRCGWRATNTSRSRRTPRGDAGMSLRSACDSQAQSSISAARSAA